MANEVTSHNDRTLMKALRALTKDEAMSMQEGLDAIDRVMDAGLLFREPAEKTPRTTKNDESTSVES